MTQPVTFKDEINFPPVIIDDPGLPVGSIIKIDRSAMNATTKNEVRITLKVRDENLAQVLKVRTRIVKSDAVIQYTCPEQPLPPSGTAIRDVDIVFNRTDLNLQECQKVEFVVSSAFSACVTNRVNFSVAQADALFDVPAEDGDIARATFWIWEISNNVLSTPQKAEDLANTCKLLQLPSDQGTGSNLP